MSIAYCLPPIVIRHHTPLHHTWQCNNYQLSTRTDRSVLLMLGKPGKSCWDNFISMMAPSPRLKLHGDIKHTRQQTRLIQWTLGSHSWIFLKTYLYMVVWSLLVEKSLQISAKKCTEFLQTLASLTQRQFPDIRTLSPSASLTYLQLQLSKY